MVFVGMGGKREPRWRSMRGVCLNTAALEGAAPPVCGARVPDNEDVGMGQGRAPATPAP